jgi:hypothetical protein
MASASSLHGLMSFLKRKTWRDDFELLRQGHLSVACQNVGIKIDDIASVLGEPTAWTLWGCAFEDFLTRTFSGGNMVDDYIKRRGFKEPASAKAYMKAIRSSVMSLYEVSDIVPGQSFLARDLVRGGDPVQVVERSATQQMRPWERIGARILPLNDTHHMCGGVLVYDMETADKLLDKLRWFEGRVERELQQIAEEFGDAVKTFKLRDITPGGSALDLAAPIFTRYWLADALEKTLNPRLPELLNTDGDAILFCTQRFALADGASPKKVRAALAAVDDLHQKSKSFFQWIGSADTASAVPYSDKPGLILISSHSDGGSVLAGVEITTSHVIVTTNSCERAERARVKIGTALVDLVGAPALETDTPEALLAREHPSSPASELPIPSDEKRQLTHSYLDDHYRKTVDMGLPVLGGLTPREAARTKAARDKVVTWLKYLENQGHHQRDTDDPLASYDIGWIWKELGVAEHRA